MNTLLLICKKSKYYNTPNRLVVILQEICNDIIEQARTFIAPTELFGSVAEEASERIKLVLSVCECFKQTYTEAKSKTLETEHPWNFDSKLVFARFDKFLVRVTQLQDLFNIIIEFNKLEKIEIGSLKAK